MSKLIKTVLVNESTRDFVQRLQMERFQKQEVIKGLIEDHAYDKDPQVFLESPAFKAYEDMAARAQIAYEAAVKEMEDAYKPEEFRGIDNYRWELDYETCRMTYMQA